MLKKTLATCMLLFFPLVFSPGISHGSTIDTAVVTKWKINAKPLDMVHTLDNKRVFILGDDSKVHIFSADGKEEGAIAVDKGVTGIDIAPRGELLYLTNSTDDTFTSIAVSFTTPIDITGSPFQGNENAPVVIALFSDFQ